MADDYESIIDLCTEELKLNISNAAKLKNQEIFDYFGIQTEKEDNDMLTKYCKMGDVVTKCNGIERKYFIDQSIVDIRNQEPQLEYQIERNENRNAVLEKEHEEYLTECYKLSYDVEKYNDLLHRLMLCKTRSTLTSEDEEVITNLEKIKAVDDHIKQLRRTVYDVKDELKRYRGLPPNIAESKRKITQLKKEYEKKCGDFYKDIWRT